MSISNSLLSNSQRRVENRFFYLDVATVRTGGQKPIYKQTATFEQGARAGGGTAKVRIFPGELWSCCRFLPAVTGPEANRV